MGLKEALQRYDGQRSVSNEFRVRTFHGALLSVTTILLIIYLVYTEYQYNFKTEIIERVHANETFSKGLEIEFDITLHEVPCAILSIDAADPTGQAQSLHLDTDHHVWKHRMSKDGRLIGHRSKLELGSSLMDEEMLLEKLQNESATSGATDDDITLEDILYSEVECGSCYGAGDVSECCNTCDDVKRAYGQKQWAPPEYDHIEQCKNQISAKEEEGEGCNVHGKVALSTGGGNLHLAPNRGLDTNNKRDENEFGGGINILDLFLRTFEAFNVSHTIQRLRFGEEYPGRIHQLDHKERMLQDSYGMYQYYLQIVPTTYKYMDGRVIHTHQYSVTEHMRHVNPGSGRGLPGVFFFYEVSALHVVIEERRKGWIPFFTSVAAIVGGVVTIMGMLDQMLYSSGTENAILSKRRKNEGVLMR
mmetsp:Transcript_37759/g.43126  ORF Transcript_37759/g.43126 Transcript_37759/m.43126 type:complete len:418 (+) Transcript_37759:45-1298(+)